jgi:serine/threonine protein kinase
VALQAITSAEPIPGYRIRERIGAGGYGEVWTADAPGGLVKAIKFVYGFLNEDRASRELKALNRIKTVRHPFLLSLERIEVVDGQLLIVTELAEASLKDRFDAYRAKEATGIPRDELLRYMRDTADVLDFMNEEHSLQHLDIKPENLLLLAGRVKVADFGLVKDIHDATASLMGGLTPLYAPPEVFDGRPSRRSDQYSLAIVYQEMLTGELPFPGTTAMQLARQHLHARPRLSALPEHDQEIIARALSKAPNDRFANCREMIDALDRAPQEAAGRSAERADVNRSRDTLRRHSSERSAGVEPPGDAGFIAPSWADVDSAVPRVQDAPAVTALPPLEVPDTVRVAHPTVFVGVGRSAGRILLQLRRRLADRFGMLDNLPAFQMLLLDTDSKDLMQLTQNRHGFRPDELLAMPLRHPQDYRNDSGSLLRWISRRWLYNIPKSLKTEGLRPLGRLAFIDHAEDISQRLRQALVAATEPSALTLSRETTELPFQEHDVRVVLIASVSGGTGSGVVADLAFLIRHQLEQLGFAGDNLYAVLTHSVGRNPRDKELSAINAYAALSELNHFARSDGGYPGERACGLPPYKHAGDVLRHTYLVDLGEGLSEQEFDEAAERVAAYLYLDAATSAGNFFAACRSESEDGSASDMSLRTLGLYQFSCLQDDIVALATDHLSRYAVDRWLVGSAVSLEPPVLKRSAALVGRTTGPNRQVEYLHLQVPAERFADANRLDFDSLIEEVFRYIEHELGQSVTVFFQQQLEILPWPEASSPQGTAALIAQLTKALDALLGGKHDPLDQSRADLGTLEASLQNFRKRATVKRTEAIREWLLDRVDDENSRVRGAMWLAKWLGNLCQTAEERAVQLRQTVAHELTEAERLLEALPTTRGRSRDRAGPDLPELLAQYCKHRLYERVVETVESIGKAAKSQVAAVRDELVDLERELRHLADHFDTSRTLDALVAEDDLGAEDLLDSVNRVLVDGIHQLAEQLEQRLQTAVLKDAGGLRKLLGQGGETRNRLPAAIRAVTRSAVIGMMKTLDVADVMFSKNRGQGNEAATLLESLESATPRLLRCGGAKRLLVMLPQGSNHVRPLQILHQQMGETPSLAQNHDGEFVMCYEVERISLTQVAVTLIEGRRDLAAAAGRVHARTDVNWAPLPDVT